MNICRIANKNGVGEVSSKYGYDRDGIQFEADIKAAAERADRLYSEFVAWMKQKEVTPRYFRQMFSRYYEEFVE